MNKMILIGTSAMAGLALILLGAGCAGQKKTETAPASVNTNAAAPVVQNSIVVKDQKPGDEALIDDVSIAKKGYVVVHEEDNGKAGKIIGSSELLNAGETRQVVIKMKVHPGLSHAAMLHADNGDGVFDAKLDLPIKDENGDSVMKSFRGEGEIMKAATTTKKME